MEFWEILKILYIYFIGFTTICYISKKFLEVVNNAHKKRIKHTKQYRNRKQNY